MKLKTVLFKGVQYIFTGDSLDEDGAIATSYNYENGLVSFAHYYPDEGVFRYGKKIGERSDLSIVGETRVSVNMETAIKNMIFDPGWERPIGNNE